MNGSLCEARDLRPGDDVVFLGEPHRITSIEPYDGPMTRYGCFAIARGRDDWGFALYEGQEVESS